VKGKDRPAWCVTREAGVGIKADRLEVFRRKSRMFGDSGEHFGSDFDGVVECPGVFASGGMAKLGVGAA
jgi:hypothetical protein